MSLSPRRASAYLALILALGTTAWALSFSSLPPADFTFCNGDEIKTVDPAIVTGSPEGRIIRGLFEGLCNWDPKDLRPTPGVAKSWDISADQKTYTFHLREDALWSDGSRVTAEDFVYSFRRFLHPATGAEYAYELWYIVGAKEFSTARVEPGDAVQVELDQAVDGAPPHAPGVLLLGTLKSKKLTGSVEKKTLVHTYIVEVNGRERRFSDKGDGERCRWVLPVFDQSVGIKALDERTLRITLKHPVPFFLTLMGFYPMFPVQRRCVEQYGYPLWTKPENIVTNGPFRLESRRIRDRIRMVKSETYWDRDNVHLNTVDALPIKSEATSLNLYMRGQADYIITVPSTVVPDLLSDYPDFQPAPYLATYYYRLNVTKPPLDKVQVRRALGLAVDKREIVERVTRAGQQPARSFVPLEIGKYTDYSPGLCPDHDVEEARRLLAEAGFPGGKGFPRIEILYNTSEAHQAIAELVQAQWRRNLGIDVRLTHQDWASYLSRQRNMDYVVARAGWIGDYTDPNTFLIMYVTGGANNQTGWGNAEYDRLIEQSLREPDLAKRMQGYQKAEQILMDEMPIIPLYYHVSQSMVRSYVKGYYPNVQDVHPYQGMWIDEAERDRVRAAEGL